MENRLGTAVLFLRVTIMEARSLVGGWGLGAFQVPDDP